MHSINSSRIIVNHKIEYMSSIIGACFLATLMTSSIYCI
jgi:hypothetical protein